MSNLEHTMNRFTKFIAAPRYNLIDIFCYPAIFAAGTFGHIWLAIAVAVLGVVVSSLLTIKYYETT